MATTPDALTSKQRQVYSLLGKGLTTNQIAERMQVTPQAISLHVRKMREKGIQPPSGPASVSTGEPATRNGGEDLDVMVREALERRLDEIDVQRNALDQQAEKYRLVLEALT